MAKPQIMLAAEELPFGITFHVYPPGSEMPEQWKDGNPMEFRKLYGGVPTRPKLYHVLCDSPVAGFEIDGIAEGVTFSPSIIYTVEEAPIGKRYLPYVNGKRVLSLTTDKRSHSAEVIKADQSVFYFSCCFPFQSVGLSGIPMFEFDLEEYNMLSDDEIVEFFRKERERLAVLKKHNLEKYFSSELEQKPYEHTKVLEVLARHHRNKDDLRLVELLRQIDENYLVEFISPSDAKLVPLVE